MTQEEIQALKTMPEDAWTALGYGPPGELTRNLANVGCVDLETLEENGHTYWKAKITSHGRKRLL